MKINFTKKQFGNLLKIVYWGNWMANAHRIDRIKKYEEIENYIFSFAREFGYDKYVDDEDADEGKFYPTRSFEEGTDVNEIHDEYDDETFWSELIDRLVRRDFLAKYSVEEIEQMEDNERLQVLYELEVKYSDEFDKNGLHTLKVVE